MKVTEFIAGVLFMLVAELLMAAAYIVIKESDKSMENVEHACAAKHGALVDTSQRGFICIGKNGEEL